MRSSCAAACARRDEQRKDKDKSCGRWAAAGECDTDASVRTKCPTACERALQDALPAAQCAAVVAAGGCAAGETLARCRQSCLASLHANLTSDTEGNCWYWAREPNRHAMHDAIPARRVLLRTSFPRMASSSGPLSSCGRYWATDGECASNGVWMRKTCPRTCAKLEAASCSPA